MYCGRLKTEKKTRRLKKVELSTVVVTLVLLCVVSCLHGIYIANLLQLTKGLIPALCFFINHFFYSYLAKYEYSKFQVF